MQAETFKQAAHALIDTLPDDASWRELAYVAALRTSIQQGLAEVDAGEPVPNTTLRPSSAFPGDARLLDAGGRRMSTVKMEAEGLLRKLFERPKDSTRPRFYPRLIRRHC